MKFVATIDGEPHAVDVTGGDGRYRLTIAQPRAGQESAGGEQVWQVDGRLTAQGIYSLLIGGTSYVADVTDRDGSCVVSVRGETYVVDVEEATRHIIRTRGGAVAGHGGQTLKAPMPGKITHVAVRPGDEVRPGDTLVVIEAMKMENEFKAAAGGRVAEVRVAPGQAVNPGDVLVVIGAAERQV